MKAFKLTMMAAMLAFASTAMAQEKKVVISGEDFAFGEDGTGELVINIDYETTETVVGYNFSLKLPAGVTANTKSGKMTAAACVLNEDMYPLLYDANEDDYTLSATKAALQVKDKEDGGYLFVWIDQNEKLPLQSLKGQLMTIKLKGTAGFSGEGQIYLAGLTSDKNVSLDLGNIADVTFQIGGTDGINDIQAADATAPAYNLQGIRVNNAKGLIIRDGKKMIVK